MAVRDASRGLLGASNTSLEDGSKIFDDSLGNVVSVVWTGLLNGDSGEPVDLTEFSDRSVQIAGTLGTGGTIAVEGSNDGVTYYTLKDLFGNSLSTTALLLSGIAEITKWVRVRVTAGNGSTSLQAIIVARR